MANSAKRLFASWAQGYSAMSQEFEGGDMAAGAAGVGAAGEATQKGLSYIRAIRGGAVWVVIPADDL